MHAGRSRDGLLWHRYAIAVVVLAGQAVPLLACDGVNDRAADENLERSGRQDRGRDPGHYRVDRRNVPDAGDGTTQPGSTSLKWAYTLSYSDVILSPDGRWLLAMTPLPGPDAGWATPGLALIVHDLTTGSRQLFPELRDLRRINFSPDGGTAWLLEADGRKVRALDLQQLTVGPPILLGGTFRVLDVSPSGRYLVASNLPRTDAEEWLFVYDSCGSVAYGAESTCEAAIVDTVARKSTLHDFDLPLRDLDWAPGGQQALLTSSTWLMPAGTPDARLQWWDLATGDVTDEVHFPNCADELKLQPGGTLALLAPTSCRTRAPVGAGQGGGSYDPISVIDLATHTFVTNLPGFGPVSIAADGSRAVGFTRAADMQQAWGYDQAMAVGLIVVELPSLDWRVAEYGSLEPAYLVSSDGRWAYTYEDGTTCKTDRTGRDHWETTCDAVLGAMRRLDLDTLSFAPVDGPDTKLRRYVVTPDGQRLISLTDGVLTQLELGATTATTLALPSWIDADLLSMRPQGDALVLGMRSAPLFWRVPLAAPAAATPIDLSL